MPLAPRTDRPCKAGIPRDAACVSNTVKHRG